MTDLRVGRRQKTVITVISKIAERQTLPGSCLVMIYGQDLGRKYSLDRGELTVGRSAGCEVVVDQDSVSRQHAKITMTAKDAVLRDLGSTNGTYVNDELVDVRTLADGDLIKIGRTIFKYISGSNIEAAYHEEIYRLTTMDGLTQTFNKRYLDEQLARELSRSARYNRPLSLVMSDVDHFQRINDEFGHLAGDAVLAQMAALLKRNIRREDVLARAGGEEFAFILPETDLKHARSFAEKVRRLVEGHQFTFEGSPLRITLSLGISFVGGTGTAPTPDSFSKVAEDNMLVAKKLGRNRVSG
ncbi:MAG: GGDEF domain-containing protein [Myxococcota bacterium]